MGSAARIPVAKDAGYAASVILPFWLPGTVDIFDIRASYQK
jgi:hypothetical protein